MSVVTDRRAVQVADMCPDTKPSIGFGGLGSMGGAMAARLLGEGYDCCLEPDA